MGEGHCGNTLFVVISFYFVQQSTGPKFSFQAPSLLFSAGSGVSNKLSCAQTPNIEWEMRVSLKMSQQE